jgi:hypothetical protein
LSSVCLRRRRYLYTVVGCRSNITLSDTEKRPNIPLAESLPANVNTITFVLMVSTTASGHAYLLPLQRSAEPTRLAYLLKHRPGSLERHRHRRLGLTRPSQLLIPTMSLNGESPPAPTDSKNAIMPFRCTCPASAPRVLPANVPRLLSWSNSSRRPFCLQRQRPARLCFEPPGCLGRLL